MGNSAAELHPMLRALAIALLITVPILLVVLRRLQEIRELFKRPKSGVQENQDFHWPFKYGGEMNVSICPKCYRQNPTENKFCGFSGSRIIYAKEEN